MFVCLLLLNAATLFAQPEPADPSTTPGQWYASVLGIVTVTGIGVSILKRAFGNLPYFNTVPTWVYSVIISAVLTFLTVNVWHTLPGELWQTMMQAVIMAATASGFYEWLNHTDKPLAESARQAGVHVDEKNMPYRSLK